MSTSIQYGLPKAKEVQMNTNNTYIATTNYVADNEGYLTKMPAGEEKPNQPCPFCGSTNTRIAHKPMQDNVTILRVICAKCLSQGSPMFHYSNQDWEDSKQQAYADWNRRPADQQEET